MGNCATDESKGMRQKFSSQRLQQFYEQGFEGNIQPIDCTGNCLTFDALRKRFLYAEDPIIDYQNLLNTSYKQKQNLQDDVFLQITQRKIVDGQQIYPPQFSSQPYAPPSQTLLIQLQVNTSSTNIFNSMQRPPIDLVCVFDDSGSMSGKKSSLLRKSIKHLIRQLRPSDRVCLISFDHYSEILTPFLRNTEKNRISLYAAIRKFQGAGSTKIHTGMDNAFWMIKNRQFKNLITAVYLLSDGEDDSQLCVAGYIKFLINKYNITDNFTIHTFGYGVHHCPVVLRAISSLKMGHYYYCDMISHIDRWIILSLGQLISIIGQNLKVSVSVADDSFKISRIYGGNRIWNSTVQDRGKISFDIPYLHYDERKVYQFEVQVPMYVSPDSQVLKVHMEAIDLSNQPIQQDVNIQVKNIMSMPSDSQPNGFCNLDMEIKYLRTKGGESIGAAYIACEQFQFDIAYQIIQSILDEANASQFKSNEEIRYLRRDLEKCLKFIQNPEKFEKHGVNFMHKKEYNHIHRQPCLHDRHDWNQIHIDLHDEHIRNGPNSDDSYNSD